MAKATTKQTTYHVHRKDAMRILDGIAERTFARLEAEGILVPFRRGKAGRPSIYDLTVIVPAYIQHVRSSVPASGDREARARRDNAQAELHELRLVERRKELLPREQVVAEGRAFIVATRAKLLALPRRLVQSGYVPAEQQAAVADLIREALEEMGRWKRQLDLLEAAKEPR
jgi:hypothetical protein